MTPLEQKLNQLSLSTMSRQVETTLTDAAAKNLSAAATLEWLADMELEARKQRAIDRRFKCSRLQAQPSIDAFHFHHHKSRQQAKPRILRLLDLSFLAKDNQPRADRQPRSCDIMSYLSKSLKTWFAADSRFESVGHESVPLIFVTAVRTSSDSKASTRNLPGCASDDLSCRHFFQFD